MQYCILNTVPSIFQGLAERRIEHCLEKCTVCIVYHIRKESFRMFYSVNNSLIITPVFCFCIKACVLNEKTLTITHVPSFKISCPLSTLALMHFFKCWRSVKNVLVFILNYSIFGGLNDMFTSIPGLYINLLYKSHCQSSPLSACTAESQ